MTETPVKKVVGIGTICLDELLLWRDAKAPVAGNRIVARDVQGGGMIATALVAVARLGGAAECWGAVGTDWMADMIVEGLERERVDTSQIRRIDGAVGPLAVVCIDGPTGERDFPYWTGMPEPGGPVGALDRLSDAGCLLVDGKLIETALPAAKEARRLGVPVVGDIEAMNDNTRALMEHIDYAIASEDCARGLGAGDDLRSACGMIRAMGPRCVVITLGARGLACLDADDFREMPAFEVDVVDTTGAGDVFHGAFCYGLVAGLELNDNLRLASAAAAMKCRRLGGRAGIPTREEVDRFLEEHEVRGNTR